MTTKMDGLRQLMGGMICDRYFEQIKQIELNFNLILSDVFAAVTNTLGEQSKESQESLFECLVDNIAYLLKTDGLYRHQEWAKTNSFQKLIDQFNEENKIS